MRRFLVWCAILGLALAFAAFSVPDLIAAEPLAKGTLSGTVIDSAGQPVAGAKLMMDGFDDSTQKRKPIAVAQADEAGRFRFGPMEPLHRNRFNIRVTADGFAPHYVPGNTYSVFPGVDCALAPIRLEKGRVFVGQVLDFDGQPRADAPVECEINRYVMGHTIDQIAPPQIVKTDQDGNYRTPPFGLGYLSISVLLPERQLAYHWLTVKPDGEETLEPLRLERDVPILGSVRDEQGNPIVDVVMNASSLPATTDDQGRFALHGFARNPSFQLQIRKEGFVFINWGVRVTDEGFKYQEVDDETDAEHTLAQLDIVMEPAAWIEGHAVDADTGEPVRLEKVILCTFERKPNGEVVTGGCRAGNFEQPTAGFYRVQYSRPDEYHLTLVAQGYHDAEVFTPLVKQLQPVGGLLAKMKKKTDDSQPQIATRTISGTVTRDGKPVDSGWVGLWGTRRPRNIVNAYLLRGRTTMGDPVVYESAPVRDGTYEIKVPSQGIWYVVAEQPGHTLTQAGPIMIKVDEQRQLDIAWKTPGSASGGATMPAGWEGQMWVVAFNKTGLVFETPVDDQGRFEFDELPPGRYAFKLGHDSYSDTEVPRSKSISDLPADAWKTINDPWKRATLVEIRSGRASEGISLELPE